MFILLFRVKVDNIAKVAEIELAEKEKGFVEIRKGEAIRCVNNFCGVNQWCSQYNQGESVWMFTCV